MEQRDDHGEESVEVEIPAALADRIERIFTECRGYRPRTTQESLSVLCDLASGRLAPPTDDVTTASIGVPGGQDPVEFGPRTDGEDDDETGEEDGEWDDRIDEAFPARWGGDPTVRRRLTAAVDQYVRNPNDFSGHDEREADAIATVARQEGISPDDVRDELVSSLYGNAGLPDDLAAEFFSEALRSVDDDEPTDDDETDGDAALLRGNPSGDVLAEDLGDDAFDVDSLLGTVSTPTADCERCGTSHPVNDLDTVIGSKTATIELLCTDCAEQE